MKTRHFLQFRDLSRDEFEHVFERTRWIKGEFKAYRQHWPLVDRTMVMIFEKQSTRTRLSFAGGPPPPRRGGHLRRSARPAARARRAGRGRRAGDLENVRHRHDPHLR